MRLTRRAKKAFDGFSPPARSAFIRTVAKLVEAPSTVEVSPFAPGTERKKGAGYAARASQDLRVLYDLDGGTIVLRGFTRRGDKRTYRRER